MILHFRFCSCVFIELSHSEACFIIYEFESLFVKNERMCYLTSITFCCIKEKLELQLTGFIYCLCVDRVFKWIYLTVPSKVCRLTTEPRALFSKGSVHAEFVVMSLWFLLSFINRIAFSSILLGWGLSLSCGFLYIYLHRDSDIWSENLFLIWFSDMTL